VGADGRSPSHPHVAATLLMIGVSLFLVIAAVLGVG
jgi:hypothetical protein